MVDRRGNLPGRGFWIHPSRDALALLAKRRVGIEKRFRVKIDPDEVSEQLRQENLRAIQDGLSMSAAGGALGIGMDAVKTLLARGEATWVVAAADASARTVKAVQAAAGEEIRWFSSPLEKAELGRCVGRAEVAVLVVSQSRTSTFLRRRLRRALQLG